MQQINDDNFKYAENELDEVINTNIKGTFLCC